jgi:hypothetical protein
MLIVNPLFEKINSTHFANFFNFKNLLLITKMKLIQKNTINAIS